MLIRSLVLAAALACAASLAADDGTTQHWAQVGTGLYSMLVFAILAVSWPG